MKKGSDSAALPAITETPDIRREMRNTESNYSAEMKWDEVQTEKTGPIAESKVINCKQRESQKHKETFRSEKAGRRKPEEKFMKLKQVWLQGTNPDCLIGHSSYCSDDAHGALELTRQWFYSITDFVCKNKPSQTWTWLLISGSHRSCCHYRCRQSDCGQVFRRWASLRPPNIQYSLFFLKEMRTCNVWNAAGFGNMTLTNTNWLERLVETARKLSETGF